MFFPAKTSAILSTIFILID